MDTRQYRTVEELVQIYELHEQGKTHTEVGASVALHPRIVSISLKYLTKYLRGKDKDQHRHSPIYQEAARQIRKLQRERKRTPLPSSTPSPTPPVDTFAQLDQAFTQFQGSLATFIESEVSRRSANVLTESMHLRKRVNELEKEVEELRAQLDKQKKGDLVSTLKSKLADGEIENQIPLI